MHRSSTRSTRWILAGVLGVAVLVLAGIALADDLASETSGTEEGVQTNATSESAALDSDAYVTLGSMTVAVDPKTGDLRPLTRAEANKLARQMKRMFKPRKFDEPTVAADGTLSAVVSPNVLRYSLAKVQADGTVAFDCVDGTESAIDFMTADAAAEAATSARGEE